MSRFLAVLLTLTALTPAGATSRHSALQLTCGEIKSIIRNEGAAIFRAVGCEQCDYQGYRGRQSILELLKIDGGIDELVARRATAREILTAARAKGFKTLADDGVRLVRAGTTSLDEVMRVVDLTDRMA